jgi:hypothetical protein
MPMGDDAWASIRHPNAILDARTLSGRRPAAFVFEALRGESKTSGVNGQYILEMFLGQSCGTRVRRPVLQKTLGLEDAAVKPRQ